MEEGAGPLAWRLLATLEGGALALAAAALLAHALRNRIHSATRHRTQAAAFHRERRPLRVLITNDTVPLGRELSRQLDCIGCTVTSGAGGGADGAASCATGGEPGELADALVIVGSEASADGLHGLSGLVTDDVFRNLKLLEELIRRVVSGGKVVWVSCAGDANSGAFAAATEAFDNLMRVQFEQVSTSSQCEAVWLGRHSGAKSAASSVIAALLPDVHNPNNIKLTAHHYSFR